MKRLLLCVAAALAMASCVPVDDFGAYWDKGVVDPQLEGTWKTVGPPRREPEAGGIARLRFKRAGSLYSFEMMGAIDPAASPAEDGARAFNARTLRIGKRKLLMQRNGEAPYDGILTSYEITGRTLSEYWLQGNVVLRFLRTRHPGAKNIHKNEGEGDFLVIGTFDDDVFRILSEIADDPVYWRLAARYEKSSK